MRHSMTPVSRSWPWAASWAFVALFPPCGITHARPGSDDAVSAPAPVHTPPTPETRNVGDRWVDSNANASDMACGDWPDEATLTGQLVAVLEPAMSRQEYANEEIDALAATMSKVLLSQLRGSFAEHEALMGSLGGKLGARTAPAEVRERAIREAEGSWMNPDRPSSPARIGLSRAGVRAYDRRIQGAIVATDVLPEGKAFIAAFSRYDWGVDLHETASGKADLVAIRLPVRDRNGLNSDATFTYLRHPSTKRWIPYSMCIVHPVRQPYPSINF